MRKPRFGEINLGAVSATIVGSIGGLFAVGAVPAFVARDLAYLFSFPKLSVIAWVVSTVTAWIIGGQIGPRIGVRVGNPRAEITAGVVCGFIPVTLIGLWSWYMVCCG